MTRGLAGVAVAVLAAVTVAGGGAVPASAGHTAPGDVAVVLRGPDGAETGHARLTAVPGGTRVRVEARGLTPGFHGMHVHALPQCDGTTATPFASAGGHYARADQPHGAHAGDLPPLLAAADGTARADVVVDSFTLEELFGHDRAPGAALVVHAAPDNLAHVPDRYRHGEFRPEEAGPDAATRMTGDSGGRVACGVVGAMGTPGAAEPAPAGAAGAVARMRTAAGADAGTVTVRQLAGRVEVRGRLTGLAPGFHGFHVHAARACDGTTPMPFSSAGGHLNTRSAGHGGPAGDLPALRVLANGTAVAELDTDAFDVDELFDADGAALVVHAAPDNLAHIPARYRHGAFTPAESGADTATVTTGDSGGRVLCGVLENRAATYRPVAPARLLDTRRTGTPLTAALPVEVRVPGAPRLAMLTLTTVGSTVDTTLMVGPVAATATATLSVAVPRGQVRATSLLAPLGPDGRLTLSLGAGAAHLLVDLRAAYTSEAPLGAGRYEPVPPARLGRYRIRAGSGGRVALAGRAGVPSTGVSGVLVTLTATRPTTGTHLTLIPTGRPSPETSVLNLRPGQTRAATVAVPVGPDGSVVLRTAAGAVDVLVDVLGWYTSSGTRGGRHVPLPPYQVRTTDDLSPAGQPLVLGQGKGRDVVLGGVGGVPVRGARAVVLAVTATGTTRRSHLVVSAAGTPLPSTSNLNWAASESVSTTVVTPLGTGGAIRLFNAAGSVRPLVVVLGYVDAG